MDWIQHSLIAQTIATGGVLTLISFFIIVLIILGAVSFVVKRYKRSPPNKVLVVYGKVPGDRAAMVVQNGGVFVLPVVQDYAYLDLIPMAVDLAVNHAFTRNGKQTSLTASITVARDQSSSNNAICSSSRSRACASDSRSSRRSKAS